MESTITVDSNSAENFIYDFLVTKCPQGVVRRERLDVGDIRIVTEHCTVVIERKHVPDLVSSIRDGRYKEQKSRQLAAVAQDPNGKTMVVWIVEGKLLSFHAQHVPIGFPNSQMESAIISTNVRDGIPVLRVPDAESLAETVLYLFKRAETGDLDGERKNQKRAAEGYAGSTHVKKSKNNDDPAMVFRTMLAAIPGVSMGKAASICEVYATPGAIVDVIRASGSEKAAAKRISGIECGARKLGPAVAARLVQVFAERG